VSAPFFVAHFLLLCHLWRF